jgi:Uma2 family endonuclease
METSLRWTPNDLAALPETLDDTRYEIVDGELFVARQPTFEHQYACSVLTAALHTWSDTSGLGVGTVTPGIIFAEDEAVVPDVVWISRQRLREIIGVDGKLHGPPELVIEVLSPGRSNQQRDRDAKLRLYARRGVDEYWIVDLERRNVEIFRRDGPALSNAGLVALTEELRSPLLPGFAHPVASLFFHQDG